MQILPRGKFFPSTGATSLSDCTDCPTGRYSVEYAALSECTQCTAGKYNENTASTLASSCVNCAMGTYNTNVGSGAASDCAFCPTGKVNPDTAGASSVSACSVNCAAGQGASSDSTSCESCTAGTYGPEIGLGCFECGRGKYSEAVGATAETQCVLCPEGKSSPLEGAPSHCETCTAGTYAAGEGFASCSTCNPGTSCGEGATEMETCQAGSASGAGSSSCTICPKGSYSSASGASACVTCDAGKYCPQGATEMQTCPSGKYSNTGASSCTTCSEGSYSSDENGPTECLTCQAGTSCPGGSIQATLCRKGRFSNFGATFCTPCPPYTIAPESSASACSACDYNLVANDERTECICQQGYYTGENPKKSLPVPDGVSPNTAGMTTETLDILTGYWRTSSTSTVILRCQSVEHCKGGVDTGDLCADGYTGPLCAVCTSGYASTGFGESLTCNSCSANSKATVAIMTASILTILAASLACYLKRSGETSQVSLGQRSHVASEAISSVAKKVEKYQLIVKIIFTYFQVVGSLGFIYSLKFPPIYSAVTNVLGGIVSLDFISFMPLGCIAPADFYSQLVAYTAIPVILSAMLIAYYIKLSNSPDPNANDLKVKVFQVFLTLTFIVLPSVSIKIFSTFACQRFDGDYGSYLKADFSINCNSDEHKAYQTYAALMILLFPIGVPVMYFVLLYKKREKLDPGQRHFATRTSEEDALKEALAIRAKLELEDSSLRSLSFLYSSYEPRMWWFEVFETLRRLCLTGFLVFLAPGTAAQVCFSMIMCMGSMRVYSGCSPFISDFYDSFSEVAQWQLFFTMFGALAIKANLDQENIQDKTYFDIILTLVQFCPALIIVLSYKRRHLEEVRLAAQSVDVDIIAPVANQLRRLSTQIGKVLGGGEVGDVEMAELPRQKARKGGEKTVQRVNSVGMANALAMGKGNKGKGKRSSSTNNRNIERPDDL
ncbi:hypothetical protein TL16_g12477 [Triparma laevis f. inornata]|uniref:Tyrosine-protein kinase ephrin type A/B receptor-like domain-containing protein n=1 Tax=Triparma laevis f. inornata TaxID=1714386 RepID=A0A9W7EWZ1_9STRA|nr:hypothetical protein TL16_g12477 [Triparma laevis f. inornata]